MHTLDTLDFSIEFDKKRNEISLAWGREFELNATNVLRQFFYWILQSKIFNSNLKSNGFLIQHTLLFNLYKNIKNKNIKLLIP